MKTFVRAAAVLLAAVAVAGCGAVDKITGNSGGSLLKETHDAAEAAKTVHVIGRTGPGKGFDLQLVRGRGAVGTESEAGLTIDVIVLDGQMYLRAPDAYWEAVGLKEATDVLSGRWIRSLPTAGDALIASQLAADMDRLFDQFLGNGEGTIDKGDVVDVDGVEATELKSEDGGRLYVAADGEPYLVKVTASLDTGDFEMSFSEWDEPVALSAPKDAIDAADVERLLAR